MANLGFEDVVINTLPDSPKKARIRCGKMSWMDCIVDCIFMSCKRAKDWYGSSSGKPKIVRETYYNGDARNVLGR